MAHEIWNGRAIYTGKQEDVWHGIGVYVGDQQLTSAQILAEAGLDYDVFKQPLMIVGPDGVYRPSKKFAVVRPAFAEDPEYVEGEKAVVELGTVGKDYKVYHQLKAFARLDPIVETGLLSYTAAGALKNGAQVWVACAINTIPEEERAVRELPDGMVDRVDPFFMTFLGHDGNTAVNNTLGMIRPVCSNTVGMMMSEGITAKAAHHGNVEANVDASFDKLESHHSQFSRLMRVYRVMARTKVKTSQLEGLYDAVFPVMNLDKVGNIEEKKQRSTFREKQIAEFQRLMVEGAGNGQGTVWDWFNGITDGLDHNLGRQSQMANVANSWFGDKSRQRAKAFAVAESFMLDLGTLDQKEVVTAFN